MADNEYIPVPVEVARSVAERFQKDLVLIISWDAKHGLTHTTTYGKTAFDKENAASAGQICAKALGCDLGKMQPFEDFHKDYDPARLREAEELLRWIHRYQGTTKQILGRIDRWMKATGQASRQG